MEKRQVMYTSEGEEDTTGPFISEADFYGWFLPAHKASTPHIRCWLKKEEK